MLSLFILRLIFFHAVKSFCEISHQRSIFHYNLTSTYKYYRKITFFKYFPKEICLMSDCNFRSAYAFLRFNLKFCVIKDSKKLRKIIVGYYLRKNDLLL